jgi:hypothetical protein
MDDSTSVRRLPRRVGQISAQKAAAILATAALVLVAACGGSPSSSGSSSSNLGVSTNFHQVAFSRCMRSNGVTNYPDPNSSGVIPKESSQQLGVTRTPASTCSQTAAKGRTRPK